MQQEHNVDIGIIKHTLLFTTVRYA